VTIALQYNADSIISLNLTDQVSGDPVVGATVTASLLSGDGNVIDDIDLDDQGAGLYQGVLPYSQVMTGDCSQFRMVFLATSGSNRWTLYDTVRIVGAVDSSCRLIDWTSDYLSKQHYTASDAARITARIEAATKGIQRYCNRDFLSTTYDEQPRVIQFSMAPLKQFPVTNVARVCDTVVPFFSIINTDNTVTNATFSTSATGITLTHVIGGQTTTTVIDYVTEDDSDDSDIVATINGVGHGWTATNVAGYATYGVDDIMTGQFGNCKSIRSVCGWLDTPSPVRVDYGTGILYLSLNRLNSQFLTNDFWPDVMGGQNYFGQRLRVIYTAGYNPWEIPADLQQACADIVALMDSDNRVMASESLGAYSYSVASALDALARLPITTRRILESYRDRSWAGAF
jgi:hypothetical protein